MSEAQLRSRIRKITKPGKMRSFVRVGVLMFPVVRVGVLVFPAQQPIGRSVCSFVRVRPGLRSTAGTATVGLSCC